MPEANHALNRQHAIRTKTRPLLSLREDVDDVCDDENHARYWRENRKESLGCEPDRDPDGIGRSGTVGSG